MTETCPQCGTKLGDGLVDVGAFRCPEWFAEALMVLIELEARDQGLRGGKDANKNADAWLAKYAAKPASDKPEAKGDGNE
jgi:hypothetical protein